MQLTQQLERSLIDLQVASLTAPFAVHHTQQIAQPVKFFALLLFGIVKTADIFVPQPWQRTTEGTYRVFYLPHI